MEIQIHNLVQGTDEWASFRLVHHGASEAAAMLGLSRQVTRSELLHQKHTGIAKEYSDFVQRKILDHGHDVEELARPIAEEIMCEELYPSIYSRGKLSASVDGITMDGSVAFEHKQWNAALVAALETGSLPDEYQPQVQQIMLVTGAGRVMFACSDGTRENFRYLWVEPDEKWQARIVAGWGQFDADLAEYKAPEYIPAAVAQPIMALPSVTIGLAGEIALVDNLAVFGERLNAFIEGIDKEPVDDQQFADAEQAVKVLADAEAALKAAEAGALAQASAIDEMRRTVALYTNQARTTRLMLEKLVKERKEQIRASIVEEGKARLAAHVQRLNERLDSNYMPAITAEFGAVIKGKKTLKSIRDAVDTELARAKIAASEIADRIEINLKALRSTAEGKEFLFADARQIVLKEPEDFVALVRLRLADHEEKEARRLEAERERIRKEEQAKAQQEQAARVAAEKPLTGPPAARDPNPAPGRSPEKPHFTSTQDGPKPAAKRPTDAQIVEVLALHYRVHELKVIEWLIDMDLIALGNEISGEFA